MKESDNIENGEVLEPVKRFRFNNPMKILLVAISFVVLGIVVYIFFCPTREELKQRVIEEMNQLPSETNRAYYYLNHKDKYDFMDTIYCDCFVPKLLTSKFDTIYNVCIVLGDNSVRDSIVVKPQVRTKYYKKICSFKKAVDTAKFYANNRYVFSFADKLYTDSIVPVVVNLPINEVSDVYKTIKSLPAGKALAPFYKVQKNMILSKIDRELKRRSYFYENQFSEMLDYLRIDCDTLFIKDFKVVMEEYFGGSIMGHIKSLFGTRNTKDFEKIYRARMSSSLYNVLIRKYQSIDFNILIRQANEKYVASLINRPFSSPAFNYRMQNIDVFPVSSNWAKVVDSYNDEEQSDDWKSAGNTVLGIIYPPYGLASTGYEFGQMIAKIWEDIDETVENRAYLNNDERLQDWFVVEFHYYIMEDYISKQKSKFRIAIDNYNNEVINKINTTL